MLVPILPMLPAAGQQAPQPLGPCKQRHCTIDSGHCGMPADCQYIGTRKNCGEHSPKLPHAGSFVWVWVMHT